MVTAGLDRHQVELKISDLIEQHLGLARAEVLAGTPFLDLHADFDSLVMVEIMGLLEDFYGFRFELGGSDERIPSDVHELAAAVIAALEAKNARQSGALAHAPNASET